VTRRRLLSPSRRINISCNRCSLADLCLPRGLNQGEIDHLDAVVRRRQPVRRGEYVFRVGEPAQSLYAIHSGSVKTCIPTSDGHEQILGFHLPGEVVGLDGLANEGHQCAAVAIETVHICELPLTQLEDMCHHLPGLLRRVLKLIGSETAAKHVLLMLLGKKSAEARLATFFLNLSTRFSQRGFSRREFNLGMPREDIANYLGLARETVSRIVTRFQAEGLLSVQRRGVRLHHLERLQALANAH
jgi:CRP/FNR family transcriptional regulator